MRFRSDYLHVPERVVSRLRGVLRIVVVLAVFFGAYAAVLFAYAGDNVSDETDTRTPSESGVLVYLDIDTVNAQDYSLGARVSVYPGSSLVDDDGYLVDDLVVEVSPMATDGKLTFARATRAGPLPVTLYADGDIREWPFDRYATDDVVVRVLSRTDSSSTPVPADVAVTNSLNGWDVDAGDVDPSDGQAFDIDVSRTTATLGFDIVICLVLVALPMCGLFVAIQTLRRRKAFLPPIVTWFAVMLFAVLPIRNLFPGAPPVGSWVDYAVVLWVVLGLVTAMVLYVLAWWRHGPE